MSVPTVALLAAAATGIWLDVPYVRQAKNGCGSASIAMVMEYWSRHGAGEAGAPNPDSIQRTLYSEGAGGIFASDLVQYFRQRGFRTFAFRGTWADLQEHLEKGRPLIVCLKQGGPLHYVVVAGLDPEQQLVLVNDPARRKLLKVDRATFEGDWKDCWTLLALPQRDR